MYLEEFRVNRVRNLQGIQLNPHRKFNVILGSNGSGKTSLLESIHLLANGHSFRSRDIRKVISHGHQQCDLFAIVRSGEGSVSNIGLSRSLKGDFKARIDGENINRISTLTHKLPTVSIETRSLELIEGAASVRRNVLDLGMFHVEHSYLSLLTEYRRILAQKRAVLISKSNHQIPHWNRLLAESGEVITNLRTGYLDRLVTHFKDIWQLYGFGEDEISFTYRKGWNEDRYDNLAQSLEENINTEKDQFRCLYGPHRADLSVLWNGKVAKDSCSRGQKKLLLYGFRLAQIRLLNQESNNRPLLLLDDLPAELDSNNRNKVVRFLMDNSCQVFVTAIEFENLSGFTDQLTEKDYKMFHVEHGTIRGAT